MFLTAFQHRHPNLSAKSTRLVFKATIFHGPGSSEDQRILIGTDDKGRWDVLWVASDWLEGKHPLAWVAKGNLRGRALRVGLVHAWFQGSKNGEDASAPPFDEFTSAKHALLDASAVQAIIEQVWPEDRDESNQRSSSETSMPTSTNKESPTQSSDEQLPLQRGLDLRELTASAILWGSSLTPEALEYLEDQGL